MEIKFDNVTASLTPEGQREHYYLEDLRKELSVLAPGAQYTREYIKFKKTKGRAGWHGKVSFIGLKDGKYTIPTGMVPDIKNELWKRYRVNPLIIDARPKAIFEEDEISLDLRDYQKEAVYSVGRSAFNGLPWPRGIISAATGCVDCDTEFLSPKGWVKIANYNGEKILQYNLDGTAEFITPLAFIKEKEDFLWEFHTKYGIDQCLSSEHNVPYRPTKSSKNIRYMNFEELKERHEKNIRGFSGYFETTFNPKVESNLNLTESELRLQVAIIADGSFNNEWPNNKRVSFNFKKESKRLRLKMLLKEANIKYTESCNKETGYKRVYFEAPIRVKEFDSRFYSASKRQLEIIATECLHWDGDGSSRFFTTRKASADFFQYAVTACGYRASIGVKDRIGRKRNINNRVYTTKSVDYVVHFTSRSLISIKKGSGSKPKISRYKTVDGYKYCFTVPSGMFVARRNNSIFITGNSGKSEIAIALCQKFPVSTLFLVHLKQLLYQAAERFEKYGIKVGILGDGKNTIIPNGINIAMIQTIESFYRNGSLDKLEFMKNVKMFFGDEVHLCAASLTKGNQFFKVLSMLPNAYARIGLSATPFKRDSYSNMLLKGATGDVLYSIGNDELIKMGYLTPPEITIVKVPKIAKCSQKWPECYDQGIILNPFRTKLVIDWYEKVEKPCLIMTTRVTHAQILQDEAERRGHYLPLVYGKSPKEERRNVLDSLGSGELLGAICTRIFDEGMDLPELRSIILAGAGRSEIKQLQRLGRGLRLATGKEKVTVVDFYDESSRLLKRHSEKRLEIWHEQGFQVNGA